MLDENSEPGGIPNRESILPEIIDDDDGAAGAKRAFRRLKILAVLGLAAILYFVRLGARALWASEFRWGEVAREMLLTRNYFWPTIDNRVYFDKPLGSYWLVVASTWLTGHMDEAAVRLPCAAAGVLAIALLILLTRRLYDVRTSLPAGFILATSFSFVFWARTTSADMETVAGELAALLIFARGVNRPGWWVVAMWLVMALTSLMKGLLGFVLPLIVIGTYSCLAAGWREALPGLLTGPLESRLGWLIERNRWLFNRYTIIAIPLAGLLYLAPFAVSYGVTGSDAGIFMVYQENIERFFAPFDHRGPIYLYTYVIFELMAPWSLFLPAALIHAHGRSPEAGTSLRSSRFVLVFFWSTFFFFTLSGSRRSYYILPILPPAAILVARVFVATEEELSKSSRLLLKIGFGLLLAGLILAAAALLPPRLLPAPYCSLPILPNRAIFGACWILSLAAAAYTCARYSRGRMLCSVGIISYLFLAYLFIFAMPAGDRWRGERRFAETTRRLIDGDSARLAAFKTQPPVFYLGLTKPVVEYDSLAELQSAIRSDRIKWVILRRRDLLTLGTMVREAAFEPAFRWDSQEHRLNCLVLVEVQSNRPGFTTSSALPRTEIPNPRE